MRDRGAVRQEEGGMDKRGCGEGQGTVRERKREGQERVW